MSVLAHPRVLALVLASCVAACPRKSAVIDESGWVGVSSEADTSTCADVRTARVCWPAGAPAVRVPRAAPTVDAEAWRCVGQRGDRKCRRRKAQSSAFACGAAECVQDYPRVPDDGEWECFERAGAIICRGGEPASGVVSGARDLGWICGDAADGSPSARLCIDLDPDPPPAGFEACQFRDATRRVRRVCDKRHEARLGDRCEGAGAGAGSCPRGAACIEDVCLPAFLPKPTCWLDTDCGADRRCVLATCVASAQ